MKDITNCYDCNKPIPKKRVLFEAEDENEETLASAGQQKIIICSECVKRIYGESWYDFCKELIDNSGPEGSKEKDCGRN